MILSSFFKRTEILNRVFLHVYALDRYLGELRDAHHLRFCDVASYIS